MQKSHASAALNIARKYSKRYAEGGDVERPPVEGILPEEVSIPTAKKVLTGMGKGLVEQVATPGHMMEENPYPKGSEEWQFFNDSQNKASADWGPGMAMGMIGTDTPFAQRGALGIGGGKPAAKPFPDYNKLLAELEKELAGNPTPAPAQAPVKSASPDFLDTTNFEKVSGAKGSNPGGTYVDQVTGEQWYIKTPKSEDHVRNEMLAAKLYELAGVHVPEIRLTELNGKPAIASKIIEGKRLDELWSEGDAAYPRLQSNFPADAWLANHDVIGTGKDNIVIANNGVAHRIDLGGALDFRAQGAPKNWGHDVPELKSMRDPKYQDASDIFGDKHSGEADTAKRIADIPVNKISDLVNEYGPKNPEKLGELYAKLIKRRDAIKEHYFGKQEDPHWSDNMVEPAHEAAEQPYQHPKVMAQSIMDVNHGIPAAIDYDLKAMAKSDPDFAQMVWMEMPKDVRAEIKALDKWHGSNADAEFVQQYTDSLLKEEKVNHSAIASHLFNSAKDGFAAEALSAKKSLPLITKKLVNKELWKMKAEYKGDNEAIAALNNLFWSKKSAAKPQNVDYLGGHPPEHKIAEYTEKDIEDYYKEQDEKAQAQHDAINGYKYFPTATKFEIQKRFQKLAKPIEDWVNWEPPQTFGKPFLTKKTPGEIKKLGFNPKLEFLHGSNKAWFDELHDPMKAKPYEQAFFTSLDPDVPAAYNEHLTSFVARPTKAFEIDWPSFAGMDGYYGTAMNKLIDAARAEGADMIAIHNIYDLAKSGSKPHTQYAFLNTAVLRHPEAKFDPAHLHLSKPLLGLVGGGLFTYGVLRGGPGGGQKVDDKMQRGGGTPPRGKSMANGAAAKALSTVRKYAGGGGAAFFQNQAFRNLSRNAGMIHSSVPGRTDKIKMGVQGGSYIIPADIVSGLGQGNSIAGAKALNSYFKVAPGGANVHNNIATPHVDYGRPMGAMRPAKSIRLAPGGTPEEGDKPVEIIAAGGEYTVPPETVAELGGGNISHGHAILDQFVLHKRKELIGELKKLKPPKRS